MERKPKYVTEMRLVNGVRADKEWADEKQNSPDHIDGCKVRDDVPPCLSNVAILYAPVRFKCLLVVWVHFLAYFSPKMIHTFGRGGVGTPTCFRAVLFSPIRGRGT